MSQYIGVDPSIVRPGVAIINEDKKILYVGSPTAVTGSLPERIRQISIFYESVLITCRSRLIDCNVIIEQPEPHNSLKGKKAHERGDLVKLSASFGAFITVSLNFFHPEFIYTVTPSAWKNGTPKEVTRKRMLRRYPDMSYLNHDEIDALALANYLYEKLTPKEVSPGSPDSNQRGDPIED